jgi:hypothetical protein
MLFAFIVVSGLILHPLVSLAVSTGEPSDRIIDGFKDPDVDARVMARTWFPDSGAGATEEGLAMVEKQIKDMARGGLGGIELAYIADATNYDNEDARENGWGTENWRKVMKRILKTANAVEGGFKVDITITSHWPPSVSNLDPNDTGASVEASYAFEKITRADLAAGKIDVPLPEQKTQDSHRNGPATFLFEDKFISATIARVKEVKGNSVVIEFDSLQDVSGTTTLKTDRKSANGYAGYPVGIPDEAYCKANGLDYQTTVDDFGPEPSNPNFEGKIDADGNRRRMADWQYLYETDLTKASSSLSASKGDELAAGDYIIFGSYYRGTGQVMSGGASIPMYNRQYATDYFSEEGVQKIFDYWKAHILDNEMMALLKENARINGTTSIFEDSIELHKDGASWTHDLMAEFEDFIGYDAVSYVPALVVSSSMGGGFPMGGMPGGTGMGGAPGGGGGPQGEMPRGGGAEGVPGMEGGPGSGGAPEMGGAPPNSGMPNGTGGTGGGMPNMGGESAQETSLTISFDDTDAVSRLKEDYNLVMGNLYSTEHAAEIKKWASSFGYTYRAQGYPLTGLDVDQAALALDVPEGDNATAGDGIRQFASAVNMAGKKMLSMESTTFSASINSRWEIIASRLNADFADGINRSIVHGSAFARTFNGYYSNWPGWNFGRYADMEDLHGYGFSSWNGRQIYWDDVDTISGYIARTQSVLQNGRAKIDLAVLIGSDTGFSNQSGNSLRLLLNRGYTYNVMSEPILKMENVVVKGGVLSPEGPAYKALVIKEARKMSAQAMDQVLDYAGKGLPIVLYNSDIASVYGTDKASNNDAALAKSFKALTSGRYDNVATVSSDEQLLGWLTKKGINPAASYGQSKLESLCREAEEGIYYYLFNDNGPAFNSGNPMEAAPEVPEDIGFVNADDSIEATVTLTGEGTPYFMDAWTGEIIPVAEYTAKDGAVTLDIALEAYDAIIVGIIKDTTGFPAAGKVHATEVSGGEVLFEDGALVHRARAAGDYDVVLSDGSRKTVHVKRLPEVVSLESGWDLRLESWGPGELEANLETVNRDYSVNPTVSEKTDVAFDDIDLGIWNDLPVTRAQLKSLGVSGMEKVVGIGVYTIDFKLPKTWDEKTGALLALLHNENDMIASVTVNGNLIDNIDQMTDTADVGSYLKKGKNTIEVKLDSTLQNRDPATVGLTTYGLTGVSLIPYCQTTL